MVNEWLAVQRVGEWAGLSGERLERYETVTRDILEKELEEVGNNYNLNNEFFEFLNEAVFSSSELVSILKEIGANPEKVGSFEAGSVPVEDTFSSYSVVDYGLDEVADFVMLMKLFKNITATTGSDSIAPLEKLHSLVYLTNYRLSETRDPRASNRDLDFGMLERTGYRYSFKREDSYCWSESLHRDVLRLCAWGLLETEPVEQVEDHWSVQYRVSLGPSAQMFLLRFSSKIESFRSVPLKEWEIKQEDVLDDFANVSQSGINRELNSIPQFTEASAGGVILNGRPKRFSSNPNTPLGGIQINA